MKLKRKAKPEAKVPTTAMPDIVFMLIFFFMVSSVLRESSGLPIDMPEASQIIKMESRVHIKYIWVDKTGQISIEDKFVEVNSIRNLAYAFRVDDPELTISIRADQKVPMELMDQIHKELRQANTLKINYSSIEAGG